MNLKEFKKRARLIRDNEVYQVYDLPLQELVVSMTVLHPGKETKGHSHDKAEEVYFFLEGEGKIKIEQEVKKVKEGELIPIKKGAFHKVFNLSKKKELVFLSVFEKYSGRGKGK